MSSAQIIDHRFSISNLPATTVDLIVDRDGYFPVKITDLRLEEKINRLEDRLIMYPSSTPVALPGQLYVELKQGSTIHELKPVLSLFDGLKIHPEPGNYRLEVKFRGRKLTQMETEDLCRRLLMSRIVKSAGPMANFTSVY